MDANLALQPDELASLEAELRPQLLDVYMSVGQEALGQAILQGNDQAVQSLDMDLDFLVTEIAAIRVNATNRAMLGPQAAPDLDPREIEEVRRRAAGLTLTGDGPAAWHLAEEGRSTVGVTPRLAAFGVRPETIENFRAGAAFLDAAAEVGEGTASKEPRYCLSYGQPATVRELRFVGSELEALAAAQLDAMKKTTPSHDVQYVVITGGLEPHDIRALGEELRDTIRAIKAQPGPGHVKGIKAVVALPASPEGKAAQKIADGLCGMLDLQPEFGKLMAGTYGKELAGREAEFIKREKNRARQQGTQIGPKVGASLKM